MRALVLAAAFAGLLLTGAGPAAAAPLTSNGLLAYRCGDARTPVAICTSFADGRGQRVAIGGGTDPSWSPDGTQFAYVPIVGGGIFVASIAGAPPRQVVGEGSQPSWSPDGSRIAYVARGGLRVVGADGSGDREVAATPAEGTAGQADWSPDGTRLVFTRVFSESRCDGDVCSTFPVRSQIATVPIEGGPEQVLTDNGSDPAWSPDGATIAYTADPCLAGCDPARPRLRLFNLGTGMSADTTINGLQPAWSPDNAKLAYTSLQTGAIQVAALNGSGTIQACVGASEVDWQPAPQAAASDPARRVCPPLTRPKVATKFTIARENHPWSMSGRTPRPSSRRVRIVVDVPDCGAFRRLRVRRTDTAIVITTGFNVFRPLNGRSPRCPDYPPQVETVKLRGRLGSRVLIDGATTPPAQRFP